MANVSTITPLLAPLANLHRERDQRETLADLRKVRPSTGAPDTGGARNEGEAEGATAAPARGGLLRRLLGLTDRVPDETVPGPLPVQRRALFLARLAEVRAAGPAPAADLAATETG